MCVGACGHMAAGRAVATGASHEGYNIDGMDPSPHLDVAKGSHGLVNLLAALLQGLASPEHSRVVLHHTLREHSKTDTRQQHRESGQQAFVRASSSSSSDIQHIYKHIAPSVA